MEQGGVQEAVEGRGRVEVCLRLGGGFRQPSRGPLGEVPRGGVEEEQVQVQCTAESE